MLFLFAPIHDQFLPATHPKRILFFKVGTDIPKPFRFWNRPRAFSSSGSGSRTDSDILAVPGQVLKDFCPRVRFSGTWTDPGTTLAHIGLCTESSKSVHEEIFMWPVTSEFLLKLLWPIMGLPNLPHDVNSIVLLNFVICFNGLLAVRTG